MNINFHYFVVKTLAVNAGLQEEEAQIVAFFSEFVDDMILNKVLKGKTEHELSRVIVKDWEKDDLYNLLAREYGVLGDGKSFVNAKDGEQYSFLIPSITSFSMSEALTSTHQYESVIPFHFYPKKYRDNPTASQRADLRTEPATPTSQTSNLYHSIQRVVRALRGMTDKVKRTRELVKLGVLLHIYADTYAHAGFSGSQGWENNVRLMKLRDGGSATFISKLPEIMAYGHLQLVHLPDLCNAQYTYRRKETPEEKDFTGADIVRDNRAYFEPCAEQIFLWFSEIEGNTLSQVSNAKQIAKAVMEKAASILESEDTLEQFKALREKWMKENVGDIPFIKPEYQYNVNEMLQIAETEEKTISGYPVYTIGRQDLFLTFTKVTYDIRKEIMGKY